jgi:glycosyltransferase involved in cell wall biosynthesis
MKVSIITPVYNQAKFIEETVNSVLGQDYYNIEYIVIDDGSNDGTDKILMSYIDRLKYVRHENMGENKTVNKGYHLCSGDVIGVVNSDDPLLGHDAVSRIVECFENNSYALAVYPDWVSIDEWGNVLNQFALPQYDIKNMLEDFNVALGPGVFIKSNALMMVGYRNESLKYTGDLDLSFRLALVGHLAHIPAFLATHRIHSTAASSTAQGSVMAEEVVRLAKVTLDSPILPPFSFQQKRKILAQVNFIASSSCYCGTRKDLKLKYVCKSIFLYPTFIVGFYLNKIVYFINKKTISINSLIPKIANLSIASKVKNHLKIILNRIHE